MAMEAALSDLLGWADGADRQIQSEWGVGSYVEDELLTATVAVLSPVADTQHEPPVPEQERDSE